MSLPVEEVRLNLPHIELAARLYGPEDGRPVIAAHGWLDNSMSFSRLAPRLQGLRIVALDMAGHGHSQHRPAGADYNIWDYAHDMLQVAAQFGWKRFSLMGHSMGGIVSTILAGAMPDKIEHLALIDGVVPYTGEAESAPKKLSEALKARMALPNKRKPTYASIEDAIQARMGGMVPVSYEAAERLAQRGLVPVPGGFTWRTDPRLTLPSSMRLTWAHACAFVRAVKCPTQVVVAAGGMFYQNPALMSLLDEVGFEVHALAGGHHLHLDDEAGADLVADCFNPFFAQA